jgi:hypothetical protein
VLQQLQVVLQSLPPDKQQAFVAQLAQLPPERRLAFVQEVLAQFAQMQGQQGGPPQGPPQEPPPVAPPSISSVGAPGQPPPGM